MDLVLFRKNRLLGVHHVLKDKKVGFKLPLYQKFLIINRAENKYNAYNYQLLCN